MSRMNIFKISKLFIILPIIFSSCLGLKQPSPKLEYYTLDYTPTPVTGFSKLPHVIKVKRFTVAPLYHTNRIIYQDQVFKRDAYIYHRWRIHPGDMISYLLTRDFRYSGLFEAVIPYDNHLSSPYILDGNVEEFLERDVDTKWEAVLSISIMLIHVHNKQNDDQIVFQKTYHKKSTCARKHPEAFAEAMSLNMSAVSREMVEDIYDYLKAVNPKP